MNVYIDKKALETEHSIRGVGSYTKHLIHAIRQTDDSITFTGFSTADIIHYPYLDLFKRTQNLQNKNKTVITIHDVIPLLFKDKFPVGIQGKINFYVTNHVIKKIAGIITDSQNSKKDIVKYMSVPTDNITVVPLAASDRFRQLILNEKEKDEFFKRLSIPGNYFLYVGDINWNKNLATLVNAFEDIAKENSKIYLVMAGKALVANDTIERRELEKKINSSRLSKRVIRIGYVAEKDLVKLYNCAIAYVQPSYYEGFGLPVLEAMQCGTPIISSNTSSLPEIVQNAGIYIDPYDTQSIIAAMGKMLSVTLSKRTEMINRGLTIANQFSWKRTAKETIKVYKKVVHTNQ